MGRRDELSARVDVLVASARARRIREAWADAAGRLGLEHTVAATLFEDVIAGLVDGVPVRAEHFVVRDMHRLHMVIEADAVGALPRELSLDPRALLEAYDRAREDEEAPSSRRDGPPSSVYRERPADTLDDAARARLGGTASDAIGAAARDGKIVYQHAGPVEDGAALADLLRGVATLVTALSRTRCL